MEQPTPEMPTEQPKMPTEQPTMHMPSATPADTSTTVMHKHNCACRVCTANLPECTHKLQSGRLRLHCCVKHCGSKPSWGCRICDVDYCNKCVPPAAASQSGLPCLYMRLR